MTRSILIVGGGIEAVEGIRIAKGMSLVALVLDRNPNAPARAHADGFIQADVYGADEAATAALDFSRSKPVHGVIALAVDAPLTVARIAETLGVEGPTVETARLATDKLRMKERFAERGIPIPWFSAVRDAEHLRALLSEQPGSLVVKPVDSRGSRGVLRLESDTDIEWAYRHSHSHSPSGRVMVEQWIDGPQISTESVVFDGEAVLCGTADRNYSRLAETAPYVVEDGGGCPSRLSPDLDGEFNALMQRSAEAIGLERGTIKGDIVVGEGGPVVIEVAARLSGGYFSTHTIPLVYDINLVGVAIQIALGDRPDMAALRRARVRQYQANRFFFLPRGTVRSVRNVERVRAQPWVKVLEMYVAPGTAVAETSDHTRRGGTVLTVGDTREVAAQRAEQAVADIEVVVTPAEPPAAVG